MSDQDLRKVLRDVMEEIDSGRLRPLRPKPLRGTLRGAMLAAALGLSTAACDGRAVGGDPDAGTNNQPDATLQLDAATQPIDASDPQVDSGPVGAYGIPEVDSGTVYVLDGGATNLYLAVSFDGGDVEAYDAGPQTDLDANIDAPAYMAPPVPRSAGDPDDSDDSQDTE